MSKEVRDLIRRAEEQGFQVKRTRRGHYMIKKDGKPVTTVSGTPSDRDSLKNCLAQLKRAGFINC